MAWSVVPAEGLRCVDTEEDPRILFFFELFAAINELESNIRAIKSKTKPHASTWWTGGISPAATEVADITKAQLNFQPATTTWIDADEGGFTNMLKARDSLLALIVEPDILDTEGLTFFTTPAPDNLPLTVEIVEAAVAHAITDAEPISQYDFRYWKMLQDVVDYLRYYRREHGTSQLTWATSSHLRKRSVPPLSPTFWYTLVADAWAACLLDTESDVVGEDLGVPVFGDFGYVWKFTPFPGNYYYHVSTHKCVDFAFYPVQNHLGTVVDSSIQVLFPQRSKDLVPDSNWAIHVEDGTLHLDASVLTYPWLVEIPDCTIRYSPTPHPVLTDQYPILVNANLTRIEDPEATEAPTACPITEYQPYPTTLTTWHIIGAKIAGFKFNMDMASAMAHNQ